MSSPSTISNLRRAAAAVGTSAVLGLVVAGPSQAMKYPDPPVSPPVQTVQECEYVGGASVVRCHDVSVAPKSGAGSSASADRGIPQAPVAPDQPRIIVPAVEPTNVPVLGIGLVAAAVLAGGLAVVAGSRRRVA